MATANNKRIEESATTALKSALLCCPKPNTLAIRCGANLLLGEETEAQKCFDQLTAEEQDEFLYYPICVFGKLQK